MGVFTRDKNIGREGAFGVTTFGHDTILVATVMFVMVVELVPETSGEGENGKGQPENENRKQDRHSQVSGAHLDLLRTLDFLQG